MDAERRSIPRIDPGVLEAQTYEAMEAEQSSRQYDLTEGVGPVEMNLAERLRRLFPDEDGPDRVDVVEPESGEQQLTVLRRHTGVYEVFDHTDETANAKVWVSDTGRTTKTVPDPENAQARKVVDESPRRVAGHVLSLVERGKAYTPTRVRRFLGAVGLSKLLPRPKVD